MYRGCGSQPGALCFLMHFQWLREHCFNKASSQRALPRGFGWRGSEAANELEPIEGCWDHRGGDTQRRICAHLQAGTQGRVWSPRLLGGPRTDASIAPPSAPLQVPPLTGRARSQRRSPRPRALPRGAEGVRAAPQNPSHLLPLCAVGFGDTCERYPVQSRAALCAPLPVSGCHSTSAAVFVWKPPSRWGLGYGWGPLRGQALLPDPAQPEPGEPAGAATPPSLAFPSCSVPTLPGESASTPREARRDP